jgi:hypothetical protein
VAPEGGLQLGHRTFGPGELAVMAVVEPGTALEVVRTAVTDGADIVEVAGGSGAAAEVAAYVAALRDAVAGLVVGVSRGRPEVEIGAVEIGTVEIGAMEIGTAEIGTAVIGAAVIGPPVLVSLPEHDLAGSLATAAVAAWAGARVFRVGQLGWVRETRRALRMVSAIRGDIPPAYAVRGLA